MLQDDTIFLSCKLIKCSTTGIGLISTGKNGINGFLVERRQWAVT